MNPEHREHRRAPLSGAVKFYQWDKPVSAQAAEISATGIFLKTSEALPEGAMLTLRVALPGISQAFTVLGKVVRNVKGGLLSAPGIGVRFLDLNPASRDLITEYVSVRALEFA